MRKLQTFASIIPLAAASFLAAGCDEEEPPVTPEFEEGQGQEAVDDVELAYPEGPYGTEVGSIVADFKFYGFPNPSADQGTAQLLKLSDFYNPTGTGVYPEGSMYGAGKAKPKALQIIISSVWCIYCQEENREVLPGNHAEYGPRGAEFLVMLADGPEPGTPAEFSHLTAWTTKYKTAWPSAIDPAYSLELLYPDFAYPINMIIDTTTMELVENVAGVPNAAFYNKLEALLDP